ncbi:serine protease, S1-C subfamily, contains C-terminal PDZ domain [Paenibacillus tianmuensis]|uniref:Serine protease, S1-C subfamily, contains C-terminal PDZ domain n=1 Tax=Paenibacillus tianmuensis TaxID=624147 RepID=A0A1G4R7V7_9BACL|nr:trypsin-like peptidase domain-containing protein [Paenibacillus tianmuensis]SCW52319.1 serine protease, S1-C subfamily, contains C-terminal PDZ domain [Paenibacillus tianmuensis]
MDHSNNNSSNKENDLFRRPTDELKHSESEGDSRKATAGEETAASREQSSHYFSYGPYKSGTSDTTVSDSQGSAPVEVTPPKALRTFGFNSGEQQQGPMGNWQLGAAPKKSSGFRSMFAAFMAGVVVVGTLMFASDKMNLFTGAQGMMAGNSNQSSSAPAQAANNNGNVKPSSLDLARPTNISGIVQQASPAVVKIETKVKTKSTGRSSNPLFDDPFFRQFFGDDSGGGSQQPKSNEGQLQPGGIGTGFIFEKTGYILTNEHVIDGAEEIWVKINSNGSEKSYKAQLLGNSYDLDLAALKIEPEKGEEFPTLPIGSADSLNVGDWVVAIGNPYGFDHTVTVGVLSAKERPVDIPDKNGTRQYKHLLQTDASINPGNSGGPLLNLNGEVIGINTAVSAQAQGIGFAIPTSTISAVLDNLKNNVKIPKEPVPYIGVQMQNIDKDWISELKLENTEGAIVAEVERKSPAFKAGIRPYDVITEVNGTKMKTSEEVVAAIKKLKAGDKVTLGIIRDGKKQNVDITIGDRNTIDPQKQQ